MNREQKTNTLTQTLGWEAADVRRLNEDQLDEALRWAKAQPATAERRDQLSMFQEDFGPAPEPVRCRLRPKGERREHAGGTPDVVFDEEQHTQSVNFDFEEIYRNLDGEEDRASVDLIAAATAMMDILDWIEEPWQNARVAVATERVILCKRNVYRLIMRPQSLGNPTVTQLANRLGVTKQFLSKLVTDFRDRFGVVSVWMKSAQAREAYREAHLDN
jgi:hypothetical protein